MVWSCEMTMFEKGQLIVSTLGTIALLLTLYVYYRQLRTMRGQLDEMKHGAEAQNILAVASFIQDEEVRKSREVVRVNLSKIPYNDWTKDHKRDASRVCANYDIAAIIIRLGIVPRDLFLENWAPSVQYCFEVLKPYIEEMQKPENSGPKYWDDFVWLYEQTNKYKRTTV
jgi:hypothetical protein